MNVLISGLNGFIGQAAKRRLEGEGCSVMEVMRDVFLRGGEELDRVVSRADVIVNLAGVSIAGRWSEERKRMILESRRMVTRHLRESLCRVPRRPRLFISASAVGVYRSGAFCDEDSTDFGHDFLAEVVNVWEGELKGMPDDVRLAVLRFGVVIGCGGGVLARLLPVMRAGLSVVLGKGTQPFPLVHVEDVTGFMAYALTHEDVRGVYNMVIPHETDFYGFVMTLDVVKRPLLRVRIPERLLRLALGDAAVVLTGGAHVMPRRLLASGYVLKYPDVGLVADSLKCT